MCNSQFILAKEGCSSKNGFDAKFIFVLLNVIIDIPEATLNKIQMILIILFGTRKSLD